MSRTAEMATRIAPQFLTWALTAFDWSQYKLIGFTSTFDQNVASLTMAKLIKDLYPDVTIVCGPRTLDREDQNAVTNPTLIVEVLSRSTEEYDRGDKFEHYKRIPSLQQYVLVGFRERQLEVWSRRADGWKKTIVRLGEVAA